MLSFTPVELAALNSIFDETPGLAPSLKAQVAGATVTKRINSGAGFFTTISVRPDTVPVNGPFLPVHETGARVRGLEHGRGFVLFMTDGRLSPA